MSLWTVYAIVGGLVAAVGFGAAIFMKDDKPTYPSSHGMAFDSKPKNA